MRVLNMQYIIDVGDDDKDDAIINAIRSQVKKQQELSPDGVKVLFGEEIK